MIFGHLGVAAAVRARQGDPRGTLTFLLLCAASVAPDIVDVAYYLVGFCSPFGLYSHTIPAVAIEAAVVGGVALLITDSPRLAVAFAGIVVLHLAADFFTMQKLLVPGGDLVGLNFYDTPPLDFLVEVPVIVGGWWLLRRSGRGPRWVVDLRMLALLVSCQTALVLWAEFTHRNVKPNACVGAPVVALPRS